ncbi:MAG: hypothetical protein EXS35_10025 [Pedosphaera sp.]|nr:hypothetical protein [Pedosphaera sp.]
MNTTTLADKLGQPTHDSALLQKAHRVGLADAGALERLAVARGCWHYRQPDMTGFPEVIESEFTNEELAIALLSPSLPYSPHTIRLGAAMLGATGNRPDQLAQLAKAESCELGVRYIAKAGRRFEPDNVFWQELLDRVPESGGLEDGVFPHPTRFVSMTGFTRNGPGLVTVWIRPRADLVFAHG